MKKAHCQSNVLFSGAATQIRTGDLILTKDVLYQLSHSSMAIPEKTGILQPTNDIIAKTSAFVKWFLNYFSACLLFIKKDVRSVLPKEEVAVGCLPYLRESAKIFRMRM